MYTIFNNEIVSKIKKRKYSILPNNYNINSSIHPEYNDSEVTFL